MTRIFFHPGFERRLAGMPGVQRRTRAAADTVRRGAVRLVHRDEGHYERTLRVIERDGKVFVASQDFAGHIVEWGSVQHAPQAPIRRAVRAAGMRLEETNK